MTPSVVCRSEENFRGVIFLPSLLRGFQGLNLGHQMSAVRTFTWDSLQKSALVMPDSVEVTHEAEDRGRTQPAALGTATGDRTERQ